VHAHLDAGFCSEEEQLCAVERDLLIRPSSEKVSAASNSWNEERFWPGPNGLTILFFKKLWQHIKREIVKMAQDFNNN
jgi:hypothetical protein